MKKDLSICLLQCDLHWQDSRKNRIQIQEYLKQVNGADIIVLPEMFNTGFSVRAIHLSETMEGETLAWMKSISRKKNAVLCGSIMVKDGDAVYNRFLWAEPTGRVLHYDKRHLFNLIGEGEYFTAGTERLIVDYQGWKICPLICYDLRFPVFSRNDVDYDLLLYVANWPEKRIAAWDVLLKARAIENQAYVVGLNRVGLDGNDINYTGHSQVVDAEGSLISMTPENEIGLVELTLSKEHLYSIREKLPFLKDRDAFEMQG